MPDLVCDVYSMLRTECKSMAVKCPPDSCPRIVSDAQNHDIQLQDSMHLLSNQLQTYAKPFVNCAWCKRLYKHDTIPYSTQKIHIHCRVQMYQMTNVKKVLCANRKTDSEPVLHCDIVLCNRVIPRQITHICTSITGPSEHFLTKYSMYWMMSLAYVQNFSLLSCIFAEIMSFLQR